MSSYSPLEAISSSGDSRVCTRPSGGRWTTRSGPALNIAGRYASSRAPIPALGALVALSILFAPWSMSGQARRSGFALAQVAQQAGLLNSSLGHALLDAVRLLPVIVAGALAAVALRYPPAVAALSALSATIVTIASLVALTTMSSGVEAGPWLGLIAGTTTIALSLLAMVRKEAARDQ